MGYGIFTGRLRRLFAEQFEEVEGGIVFRSNSSGAPVRVSAQERDAFQAAFTRRVRWIFWGSIGAFLVFSLIMVAATAPSGLDAPTGYVGPAGFLILFLGSFWWAWTDPGRVLANRMPLGRPRSNAERDRRHLQRLSYFQIALVPVIVAVVLLKVSERWDVFQGWGRLWLVGAISMTILAVVQAFRKWRYARN